MPQASANTFDSRGVDERLLAGDWRQARQEAKDNQARQKMPAQKKEANDLRQAKEMARKQAILKQKGGGKVAETITMPARQFTNRLLQGSIIDMLFTLGIGTFGLSILYVHAHLFGRAVGFTSFFSKLGSEWLPKGTPGGQEVAEKLGSKLYWPEVILIVLVDLIWLSIIFVLLTLIVILVDILVHPVQTFWSFAWGSIGEVFQSFF